jgi:hypothetical protein
MSLQALPRRRVAFPPLIPAAKINPLPAAPAHLWPNLSPETQAQIDRSPGYWQSCCDGCCRRT